jgi:hypothetical protein
MQNLTSRAGKGSALTNNELDANWSAIKLAIDALQALVTPVQIPFSSVIKLDKSAKMASVVVNSPINFTLDPTGALDGVEVIVRVQADGASDVTVDPTFTAVGASTYDNTAGRVHYFSFWREYGDTCYGVTQGKLIDSIVPSLTAASIASASADTVNLTWSEAMSAAIAPASAFSIPGRVITAHTRVDANHTALTVSVPFVSTDTPQLSYTVPGSGPKMQDLAANAALPIVSTPITNNVLAPGQITVADTLSGGGNAVNLDSFDDWIYQSHQQYDADGLRKSFSPLGLGSATWTNYKPRDGTGTFPVDNGQVCSWSASTDGSTNSPSSLLISYPFADTSQSASWEVDADAALAQNTVRVGFVLRRYEYGNSSTLIGLKVTLSLSDGSAAPVVKTVQTTVADYGYFAGEFKVDYKAAHNGAKLHIKVEPLPSMVAANWAGSVLSALPQYVTFKANT